MKQSSFSTNFIIAVSLNFDYVIRFCKPKKGFSSPVFTVEVLVAETVDIRQIIKLLPSDLPRAIECAAMPPVNDKTSRLIDLDKFIKPRNFPNISSIIVVLFFLR